jgi:hypothetical protein
MAGAVRLLAVLLGAALGAALASGLFWIGADHEASALALGFWAVGGAVAGGAVAALVVLLD